MNVYSFPPFPEIFNQVPTYHIYLEIFLALLVLWIICKKSSEPRDRLHLSRNEEEKIIENWQPEPLILDSHTTSSNCHSKIVHGKVGKYVEINGQKCLNLATHNYLGLIENEDVENSAITSVSKYGVGSCGPRGFYGTVDVHLDLEEKLAKFMNMEEAVVYSYGFSTVASAIPAYSKRGDIIFVDENVNFAIQKGLLASRSEIKFFKHNNIEHLEAVLEEQACIDLKNSKKADKTRKFLIVEGIYMNSGDICPLPELIEVRKKYKLRIFIDESISFGTLGQTGRGVTEYFNVPITEVDLIMGSLEWALASVGGFCVGSSFIVEHQRLSGLGYCFSASLPPLLTSAAIVALNTLEQHPQIVSDLKENSSTFQTEIENSKLMQAFNLSGHPHSPVKHLSLKTDSLSYSEQHDILERMVNYSLKNGIALTTAAYLKEEDKQPTPPSIRLTVNALLTKAHIHHAISIMENYLEFIPVLT